MKIIAKIKEGNAIEGFDTDCFAVCDKCGRELNIHSAVVSFVPGEDCVSVKCDKCDAIDHHSKDAPLDVWSKLDEVLASVIKNSVKEWR